MNDFYKQPKAVQWFVALVLLISGFLPMFFFIEKAHQHSLWNLSFLVYVPIAQFTLTPFFRLVGIYTYYSPMLLGYMANKRQIDLHSGGSFDYLLVMRKYNAGVEMRNRLLMYHLEGLVFLASQIENGRVPDTVQVVGTSYFFNERSLRKMGFEVVKPSLFYRLNLFVNFIDLFWMYSLSQGKVSVPKVWEAKKATISGAGLRQSKNQIEQLFFKMKEKNDLGTTR